MDRAIAIALLVASLGFAAYAQKPQDEAETNTPPKRVKVELQSPVQVAQSLQFSGSVQEIAPTRIQAMDAKADYIKPTLSPVVQDFMQKVQEAIKERIPEILAQSLQSATSEDVPKLLEIALANADSVQIPAIAEATMAHATKTTAPAILAQIYDKLVDIQVGKNNAVETIKGRYEWYEVFVAQSGSKIWWILEQAKQCAQNGGDTEDLRKIFEDALLDWLREDEIREKSLGKNKK